MDVRQGATVDCVRASEDAGSGADVPAFEPDALARKLAGDGGVAAFDRDVREHRTAKFDAAFSPEEAERLYDIARLEGGIAGGGIALDQVDIYSHRHMVRLADLTARTGRPALDVACDYLREGATLRVRDIERADQGLTAFCEAVRVQFDAAAQINLYLTPPQREGFPPHFDITDVFVVQVAGAKSWRSFGDYAHQVRLPPPDTAWDPERYTPIGAGDLMTLRQGDVLYIPRGGMHAAASLGEASLHLTVSITPMTFADLLVGEITRLSREEEGLRRRVSGDVKRQAEALLALVTDRLDVSVATAGRAARRAERRATGALQRALLGQGEDR